jgi:hypothetical protein
MVPAARLDPKLASRLDSFEVPVLVATAVRDREGRILDFRVDFANASACRCAGLEPSVLTGRIAGELLPNIRETGLFDALVSVVDSGAPLRERALAYDVVIPGGTAVQGTFDVRVERLDDGCVATWRNVGEIASSGADPRRSADLVWALILGRATGPVGRA